MAFARAWGAGRAQVATLHVHDDGSVWTEVDDVDAFDLAAFEERLVETLLAPADTSRVSEGTWCQFCQAWNACPAKSALITMMATEPGRLANGIALAGDARSAYLRLREVKAAVRRVENNLRAWEEANGAIDLGDGKYWGRRPSTRKEIDARKALPLLEERFGTDSVMLALDLSVSQKAIQGLVGSTGKEFKAVMEALEAAGAVTTKESTEVKEWTQK